LDYLKNRAKSGDMAVLELTIRNVSLERGWKLRKEGKKQKLALVLSPKPGSDGPNASGWYRRLREPILPLSLLNYDQL